MKLGLALEQAESDRALHWLLTSAEGLDPAWIGLTRSEGGDPPIIGVARLLGLVQGCTKSMANERSQDPGWRGLRSCDSARVYHTWPKVAPTGVVQNDRSEV